MQGQIDAIGVAGGVAGSAVRPIDRPRRRPVECGDMPFVIRRDGTWMYRGSPINRKELVCLFASVLKREADGSFVLETPAERGAIIVEDAPFVAVELDWSGIGSAQVLTFRTNVDQLITAGPDHPIRIAQDLLTCDPTPYIRLRAGAGALPVEARIGRAVYYELVALAEPATIEGRQMLGVWSLGCFFPLGELPEPEQDGEASDPEPDGEASDPEPNGEASDPEPNGELPDPEPNGELPDSDRSA